MEGSGVIRADMRGLVACAFSFWEWLISSVVAAMRNMGAERTAGRL